MSPDELQQLTAGLHNLAQQLGPLAQGSDALWLALDQGGHASRALVFDAAGRVITQAFAPINTQRDAERVEHDATDIAESLRRCLSDVAHSLGNDVDRLRAAGLATQRSSIVCWDRYSGAALSPVLSWQDRRQAEWLKPFEPQRELIQHTTGLVLSPHYGASKLHWCLHSLPEVHAAQHAQRLCCGPLSSYLLHQLLQEHPNLVDPANASRTLLWSPATQDWAEALLQLFAIPRSALPECVPTQHHYGHLLVGAQAVPLRICSGDQATVPYASGALRTDTVYINLGTGAFALAPLERDLPDAAPLLRSVLWSDAAHTHYALEGTVNGAAAALTWLSECTGLDTRRVSESLPAEFAAHTDMPLFINGVGGLGSPFWRADAPLRFEPTHAVQVCAPATLVASVLESIAFLLLCNLELLQQHLPQLTTVTLGGGLSRSDYLCQCLTELSSLTITRLDETELTAKGLAFLVAGAPHWPQQPAQLWQPRLSASSREPLRNRYQRWRALIAAG